MKTTRWIPITTPPVREGWYEISNSPVHYVSNRGHDDYAPTVMRYWAGTGRWFWQRNPNSAGLGGAAMMQSSKWRGLKQCSI